MRRLLMHVIAIGAACAGSMGLSTSAIAQNGDRLPTVHYLSYGSNGAPTKMLLYRIELESNVRSSAENARKLILPHVAGCSQVQEDKDTVEFWIRCIPKYDADFKVVGALLRHFYSGDGFERVKQSVFLVEPELPVTDHHAKKTEAMFYEVTELQEPAL